MKTAVLICPGRGTYNATELGYLHRARLSPDVLEQFEGIRTETGQLSLQALDTADRYDPDIHGTSNNASALIYACTIADAQLLQDVEIVAVTGNSMGWYSALACAGALSLADGFRLVSEMGNRMHDNADGGQLVYPWMDGDWHVEPQRKAELLTLVQDINATPECTLSLSIDLGGMLVLAGNEAGLGAFESQVPPIDNRFPMRLRHHAAFHSSLMSPISEQALSDDFGVTWQQPTTPMIDGRGHVWWPNACDLDALYQYTLGHQVTQTYDFTSAIRSAALEFAPDVFVVAGPGTTLGGSVAQSLILTDWLGLKSKAQFQALQEKREILRVLGHKTAP